MFNFLYLSVLNGDFILHPQVMLVYSKINQSANVLTVWIGYLCQRQKRRGTYQYFTRTNEVYFVYKLSYSLPCHFKSSKINLNMSFSKPFSWKVCCFCFYLVTEIKSGSLNTILLLINEDWLPYQETNWI